MKKIYLVVVCVSAVLFIFGVTNENIFSIEYWLSYAEKSGNIEMSFPSTFGDDLPNVFSPALWLWQQIKLFISYLFGSVSI